MRLYLGPTVERWTPKTWADIESAAAAGLLDETHWVELKKALPPADRPGTRELAKDLASLACDGGLLVVGVEDAGGRAGEVVGTSLAGLQDRIDQVAGSGIQPPLVVRSIVVPHPATDGHGCLLIVLDASPDGPHMVDERYWGRGDTGKRTLTDYEVRRRWAANQEQRDVFEDRFEAMRSQAPIGGDGVLHVLFRPRAGRRGALASLVDRAHELFFDLTRDLARDANGWSISHLDQVRRVLHGTELSNFDASHASKSNLQRDASAIEANLMTVRIEDDGTLFFSCSKLVYEAAAGAGAGERPLLATRGVFALTTFVAHIARRLGHLAGYAGSWDVGVSLTGLAGSAAAPAGTGRLAGLYGATYPDDEYLELATTTAVELDTRPALVVDRLLRPAFRVLGVEGQIEETS